MYMYVSVFLCVNGHPLKGQQYVYAAERGARGRKALNFRIYIQHIVVNTLSFSNKKEIEINDMLSWYVD